MKKCKLWPQILTSFFLVATIIFTPACSKDDDEVKPEPVVSIAGRWDATADFGGFEILVNNEQTHITELVYKFVDFSCGGIIQSGNITVSSSPGWQITNKQFEIERDLNPDPFAQRPFNISGTFSSDGKTANGNWNTKVGSSNCSGAWQAVPVN